MLTARCPVSSLTGLFFAIAASAFVPAIDYDKVMSTKFRRMCTAAAVSTLLVGCNSNTPTTPRAQDQPSTPASAPDAEQPENIAQEIAAAKPAKTAESDSIIRTPFSQRRQLVSQRLLAPEHDGWTSEAVSDEVSAKLNSLAALLTISPEDRLAELEKYADKDVQVGDLRPAQLAEVYRDTRVQVFRSTGGGETEHRGYAGFGDALQQLADSLKSATQIEPHFKVIQVEQAQASFRTRVLVEISSTSSTSTSTSTSTAGDSTESSHQVNATWDCLWRRVDQDLLIRQLRVTQYEETVAKLPNGKWFADRTRDIIGSDDELWRQLKDGHHQWLQRIERVQRFDTSVRNGLAIGDVNGDGLDDVYLCQPPGLPNRLFVHQTNGLAVEQSSEAGVDWMDQTSAALFCDLDNDGDQDLVLATQVGLLLMQNDGRGHFRTMSQLELDYDVQSLSSADYDNDGRLDLFACVYRTATPSGQGFLYRDAVGGGLNRLFRNEIAGEAWAFQDVTSEVGLLDGADRFSMAASWEDFDNDGDQDLYVANDFGRNHLYENRGGQFVDIADAAGVLDIGSGMSVSWGDYDRDGLMDLYVGNMFSSAGQRVTTQEQFRPGESREIRDVYRRLAKGNSLFKNLGNGRFLETGREAGVELGRWAWSSLFADLNNDGWEDLFVANGYMTTADTGDL